MASEVALARRDSPSTRWPARVGFAKALVHEMPHTPAALECGALSEWRATLIVRESACLDVEDRRVLDAELCGDVSKLDGMGDARVVAAAKEIACRLDVQAVVDRAGEGGGGSDGDHPAGPRHDDVCDRPASCCHRASGCMRH